MYTFFADGQIQRADLKRLLVLTQNGSLIWRAGGGRALNGYPASQAAKDDQIALEEEIGANLKGIRVGYDSSDETWRYLLLSDGECKTHYIEKGSNEDLFDLVDQLFELAKVADRLGGTLALTVDDSLGFCQRCQGETPHRYLVDCPYGILGAVILGSRRRVCITCETRHVTSD